MVIQSAVPKRRLIRVSRHFVFVALGFMLVLIMVFFSVYLRRGSNCALFESCFASSSALSLPGMPPLASNHWNVTRL